MRRLIAVLLACVATAVPLSACGRGSHRVFHGSVCAFSVWRATHDARTHHYAFAAFQAYLALHHCPLAFRHRR